MTMNIFTIYKNNAVDLVYRAAKTCVRGEIKSDFELRKKTIMNSVGMGHESLLEHTNLILCFQLSKSELIKNFTDYIDFVETLKYLNFRTYEVSDDKIILVLSGSIRGYKHIFRNIKHQENAFLQAVKGELYGNCIKEFFMDFIKDGIMDEELFSSYTVGDRQSLVVMRGDVEIVDSENLYKGKIEILSYDSLYNIQERILTVTDYVVPFVDLLNFATISIKFSDISRTASHQIVRHRAAISQESQRYVNYDFANFINPIEEKIKARDTIDENYSGYIDTLNTAASKAMQVYKDIVKSKDHPDGINKEDARAILPNNIETTVMMTFTYLNLIKAIELRVDKAAQAEIRNLFVTVNDILRNDILQLSEYIDLNNYICTTKENAYYSSIEGDGETLINKEAATEEVIYEDEYVEELSEPQKKQLKETMSEESGVTEEWIEDVKKSSGSGDILVDSKNSDNKDV